MSERLTEVTASAPATVANVAAGFDVLGFAIHEPHDEVVARFSEKSGVSISKITGDSGVLPLAASKNTMGVAVIGLLNALNESRGIELELHKKMPLGSGLGSSAASAVAGAVAVNALLGNPFSKNDLLPFVVEAERIACGSAHADNVAPSLFGGFVLIRSYSPLDVIELPTPEKLFATVIHPHIEVQTKDARGILKKQLLLKDAVVQWGNVAGLIAGIFKSDYELIGRSLHDVIVEPIRSLLIPKFYEAKDAALNAGALGCSISGSGPSMFALSISQASAEQIGASMKLVFASIQIDSDVFVSRVNQEGAKILHQD